MSPVVTLAGDSHVSRAGVSLNASVGLDGFTAESEEQYIRIAQRVASDLTALDQLRSLLRTSVRDSPLLDATGYARSIEQAFLEMWDRQR